MYILKMVDGHSGNGQVLDGSDCDQFAEPVVMSVESTGDQAGDIKDQESKFDKNKVFF
jgi:hypothetical protein